jgi:2,4-dienoyl-CoA reductase-like NADH-dependent reductase (Old Yellow Enzyme family)
VSSTATPVDPFAPARLGPVVLRNRFIKAATFEGMTPKNVPTPRLVDYHRAVAAGGVGMTTVAFCAVSRDGRGAPGELVVTDEAVESLAELAEVVHATGAKVSAQLGHAGPVAAATGYRGLAPSRVFSAVAMRWTRAAGDEDIERVTGEFAAAARRIVAAGFDAIELHLGHHYLLSAFLSPKLNKRTDRWGGGLEGRSRFPRQVVQRVREAVGDAVAVTAKLQMVDGVEGGLWLEESIDIARLLEADGCLDALQLTGGGSLLNPMYLFRGDAPVAEMAETMPRWLRPGFKLLSPRFMPAYPFEEAFFLPYARQFRQAVDMPLILLGGINRLDTVQRALAEGFEFVAMARALLREPDLVERLRSGLTSESLCIHCNKCMPTIYRGTHCVLVAPEHRPGLRQPARR